MDRLHISPRRRRRLLLLAGAGAAAFAAYRIYHLPSVTRTRRRLAKLVGALAALSDATAEAVEAAALVSSDLNQFLRSDSDEIPASLKQISKLTTSDEFAASLARVSEALTVGIIRGYSSSSEGSESRSSSDFSDRLLNKLFSSAGSNLASAVAGSFAQGLVIAFCSTGSAGGTSRTSEPQAVPQWVQIICAEKCRALITDCVQVFAGTVVAMFVDKTIHINAYDQLFAGLTNPTHTAEMKDILVSVCNGAVETLVGTSHRVLTSSYSVDGEAKGEKFELNQKDNQKDQAHDNGWVASVSSTLAVPSNRSFVLDLTGRITFETVRSFLEFVIWKLYDGARRGINTVREEVGRGLEVVRYISAKSMAIMTVCITLCLHVLAGSRVLMPA